MVCVTRQKTCARLIELGARLAQNHRAKLLVVHALRNEDAVLGNGNEAEAMELLFAKTSECGGELLIVRADDTAGALVKTADEQGAKVIVVGATPVTEPVSFAARLEGHAARPGDHLRGGRNHRRRYSYQHERAV